MNNELEIRTLTTRFFDGETSLEEEQHLYELYRLADTLPSDLQPLREMMLDMQGLGITSDTAVYPLLNQEVKQGHWERPVKTRVVSLRFLSMAASLLLLLGMAGVWYHHERQQNECVVYVYGKRITDNKLVMQEMQAVMASLNDVDVTSAMETQMKEFFSD